MSTEIPTSEIEISPETATGIIASAFNLWAETTSSINGLTQTNDNPNAEAHFEDVAESFMRQKLALEGKITQNSLRAMITPALFAGCGSTGFAAYNGIMRNIGLMPIFSDLDKIGEHNLPRQAYKKGDIGRDKSELAADKYQSFFPNMPILYDTTGISRKSAHEYAAAMKQYTTGMNQLLSNSNIEPIEPIIYDSVDVTTTAGWVAKWQLHKAASRFGIKTIGAYDIGNRSQVFYFPYDKPNHPILNGKVTQEDMDTLTPQGLNIKLLPKILGPIPNVPLSYAYQYFSRARKIDGLRTRFEQGHITSAEIDIPGVPQERIASSLYEAAVAELTWKILEGDGGNIPELMSVETTPDGISEKMKLVLLFLLNSSLIGRTAEFERSLE